MQSGDSERLQRRSPVFIDLVFIDLVFIDLGFIDLPLPDIDATELGKSPEH